MNIKITKLKQKIAKLQKDIEDIQQGCPHTVVEGEYKSNTGNWCPQDDCYWIQASCLDCGTRFHVDSKDCEELYRKLARSGMIK